MKKAIIICGGIGGAATAFALSYAGLEPVVFNEINCVNILYI
ncbi:hypothetical protein [Nostoc sp. LEGE 12447]|nr:hypothetical protein [Nostoc sp. LEGE 12447]